MIETPPALAATAGGSLLVLAILLPSAGILLSFALGGRFAERVALGIMPVGLAIAIAVAILVWRSGAPVVYNLAGLPPPLGIALRADGISCVMLVTAALVIAAAALYARANFATPADGTEARAPLVFWIMLQAIWAALTILFVGGDLFNLYVALELLTFAAVPLVCLGGKPETLVAALRYLLFALFGSVFYLLGAALLYGTYGTLDIVLLAERVRPMPAVWLAAGVMTAGLLAKTALFPLHLWLPPAHAGAPPAASAVLSGLVVKGSFFLTVRLWFYVLPALPGGAAEAALGTLGSAAILFGSVLALSQPRLKLLIAYSTLAQIGYLFLIFPLASGAHPWIADGWGGGMMQTLSHAFAKAAMFMAAGLLAESLGHDRIAEFAGAGRAMPATCLRPRPRRTVADGPAAERRLRREMDASPCLGGGRPLGVGGRDAGGRTAGRRICLSDSRPGALGRRGRAEVAAAAEPGGRRPGSGARRGRAGFCAAIVLRLSSDWPRGRDGGASMTGALGPWLLAAALAVPLLFLAACLIGRLRDEALALQWLAPVPALAAAILAVVGGPFGFEAPALRLSLRLDLPGALLLAVASLLWIVVGAAVFASPGGRPNARFAVSWLLTMAGSLGVFIAADLLTFYLVYALVSIPAYELIVGDGAPSSKRAGGVYMAFAILGEALLLMAFALLAAGEPGGSLRIEDVVAALPTSPWRDGALALLIAGFGMKMALAPLNGWMPSDLYGRAHSCCGRFERGGGEGRRHRAHPLSALRRAAARLGRGASRHRLRLRLLWRRHRDHPAESEDRARLFEHQPDGRDRRGHWHGARVRRRGRNAPDRLRLRPIMCW